MKRRTAQFPSRDWKRLGEAIQRARLAEGMTSKTLGYAIASSGKSVSRLEKGEIYGDPASAPPGDYNSEGYVFKRLYLLERALGWDKGHCRKILAQDS